MTDLVGHFVIFSAVCVALLGAPLVLGRFLRPKLPTPEKEAVYECGEPTVGSSDIQFDLRFYVVGLLFIVFDVELVFFFPWAVIFGSVTQLADQRLTADERLGLTERLFSASPGTLDADAAIKFGSALKLGWTTLFELVLFFGVLLVGFAYLWKRGDLDWVRALTAQAKIARQQPSNPRLQPRAVAAAGLPVRLARKP